jgi:chromosome segregation ATPase
MWRSLNEIDQQLNAQREIHSRIMEQFQKCAGRQTINGWESVMQVLQTLEDRSGYYGLVIENLECREEVDRAVESAAGNKYLSFHFYYHLQSKTDLII